MNSAQFHALLTGGHQAAPRNPAPAPAKPRKTESFADFQKRLQSLTREEYIKQITEHDSSAQAAKRAGEAWDAAHGVNQ